MKFFCEPWRRVGLRPLILVGALAYGLGACEQSVQVRGNLPDPDVVSKITPGSQTRNDIARLLGSPSTVSTFEDSKWYYIGQKKIEFAFFEPEVLERKVIVVSFDEGGFVEETKTYTLGDGKTIDPVDRITPTEGRELTILQQIFGNLGRYTSEGLKK